MRLPSSSSTTPIEPLMDVSGVRRSWDMARSRFALVFSRSDSVLIFSCSFSREVSVDTAQPTASIVRNVSG